MNPLDASISLGLSYYQQGNAQAGVEELLRAAEAGLRSAALLSTIAVMLYSLGRYSEALAQARQAIEIDPNCFEAYVSVGNAFMAIDQHTHALVALERSLELCPDSDVALINLGTCLRRLGRTDEAQRRLREAIAIAPDSAAAHFNLGNVLQEIDQEKHAIECYRKAVQLDSAFVSARLNLGNTLRALDFYEEAIAEYEGALAQAPTAVPLLLNLGSAHEEIGNFAAARQVFERALSIEPRCTAAALNLVNCGKVHGDEPVVQALERQLCEIESFSTTEAARIHFALGKCGLDAGDVHQAFHHCRRGNLLRRSDIFYDEATVLGELREIETVFERNFMRQHRGCGNPTGLPIFIVGMPRSGSSLVEQILASHPNVLGLGERNCLERAVIGACGADRLAMARSIGLPGNTQNMAHAVGDAYLKRINYLTDSSARSPAIVRVTDKKLDNFRFSGLIHLALPGARIVHVRRAAVDTCLSCFATMFQGDLPYAWDLGELGRYYRAYEHLMAHWRAVLPPETFFEVSYEELVRQPEQVVAEMLEFCHLPWSRQCLEFHEARRPVRTASLVQVRSQISAAAIGKWAWNLPEMLPLLRELELSA